MTLEGKTSDITITLPALIATQEFEPTAMMIKVLSVYLESIKQHEKPSSPVDIIEKLGHAKRNWYYWLEKPLFNKWWTKACEEFFTRTGLYNVHSTLYRCALLTNCPQDRRVYLDRFDPNFRPATAQEHTFKGVIPPEGIDQAVERSRARAKALASSQDAQQGAQQGPGQEQKG